MDRSDELYERHCKIVKRIREEIDENLADVIENWFEDGFTVDEISAMLQAAREA